MKAIDVIVIGAGASGLMAARKLSEAGLRVTILEARKRTGGRMFTLKDPKFSGAIEGGAEFLHGRPKITKRLLREYGIGIETANGQIWHANDPEVEKNRDIVTDHHRLLKKKLKSLKRDLPLKNFLDRHFKGAAYASVREDVIGFVEGYESASAENFSTFAFREDWMEAEKWDQHRVPQGYGALIEALAASCEQKGCIIKLGSVVKSIHWKKGRVRVTCSNRKIYEARQIVITVPLGILQQNKIRFVPDIPSKRKVWNALGYGSVIKILLQFRSPFWKQKKWMKETGHDLENLFFMFSHQVIPTWWTQAPGRSSLLTGWLSGPEAEKRKSKTDSAIITEAIGSLSKIFHIEKSTLRSMIKASKVFNWMKDEFAAGSYSYATVNGERNRETASRPVSGTLFFAGEHLEEPMGTVESALKSGAHVAEQILESRKKTKGNGWAPLTTSRQRAKAVANRQ